MWQRVGARKIHTPVGLSSFVAQAETAPMTTVFGSCSEDHSWRSSCEPAGIKLAKFLIVPLGTVSSLFHALFSPAVA